MEQRIIEIIGRLRTVCMAEDLNVPDHVLFSEACTFHRGELVAKSRNGVSVPKKKDNSTTPPQNNANDKMTGPQAYRLKKLGIYQKGLTKFEASKLIDEAYVK